MTGGICSVDEFVRHSYDYIICGGGTAGLVLAARLSELPNVMVGVIEAGKDRLEDPNILTPLLFTALLSNPEYDWMYTTSPQQGNRGKIHSMPKGKTLGGSSAINFMVYVRGSKSDYDDWANFSSPEWSFSNLLPFFKRHEQLEAPTGLENATAVTQPYHGSTGPIHTSFGAWRLPVEDDIIDACYKAIGKNIKPQDPWSGDHIGFYSSLSTIDRTQRKGTRSYAGSGYLVPALTRRNLKVLCEATVSKIILDKTIAQGVRIVHGQQEHNIRARKEVIVTCGVIGSPQLLELSGIGDPDILRAAGVECLVANSSIGANFQDHVSGAVCFELNPACYSLDSLATSKDAEDFQRQYLSTQDGPLAYGPSCMGFLPYASLVSDAELQNTIAQIRNSPLQSDFHKRQLDQVIKQLKSPTSANIQLLVIPGKMNFGAGISDQSKLYSKVEPEDHDNISIAACLQYPVSRGTVHITSSDPHMQPEIDPGYLSHPADISILADSVSFVTRLGRVLCADKKLVRQTFPARARPDSPDVDGQVRGFVADHCLGEYHGIGTCAMSQVVDERLRVKGVKGLRVADASVFPNNISGNIVASVYAVAEKAAEMIKEERFHPSAGQREASARL